VRYLGAVDRNDLPALYQQALAFVYPSSYEGFGLPILEAMAAGIPVLCSRLTSFRSRGDAALYLEDLSMDEIGGTDDGVGDRRGLRRRLVEAGQSARKRFAGRRRPEKRLTSMPPWPGNPRRTLLSIGA